MKNAEGLNNCWLLFFPSFTLFVTKEHKFNDANLAILSSDYQSNKVKQNEMINGVYTDIFNSKSNSIGTQLLKITDFFWEK